MKKRIFAALEISEAARGRAADYLKDLRGRFPGIRASWDKPEKMHLTVKFFGETDGSRLAHLDEAARAAAEKLAPFGLEIAGTGVFPSPRQARVLWLGVGDEAGNARRLHEIFESECAARGFPRESRGFKAHLTIARLKERAPELVAAHLAGDFEPAEFDVSELVVFQSELRPSGSVYTVVSRHGFAGGGDIKNE